MEILGRETTWIHTHFLTDCVRLPAHRVREIQRRMAPVLRGEGIVFGLHVERHAGERTVRLVLECIPYAHVLQRVEAALREVVRPIPARPRPTEIRILPRPPGPPPPRDAPPRTAAAAETPGPPPAPDQRPAPPPGN